jgi:hypothetical protein
MTTESEKQLQFRDIMARLEDLSAKVDEVLRRIAPNETKPPVATVPPAMRGLPAGNKPVASPQVRVDPNLGTL